MEADSEGGAAPFASKEQRGERQQNYSARCAASSQAVCARRLEVLIE
jgi:hypothetical protein